MRNQAILFTLATFLLISTSWESEVPSELVSPNVDNTFSAQCSQPNLRLNFSSAVITYIGVNFLNSSLITCLSFEDNKIQAIAKGAFDQVPNLEYLNLAGNSIHPSNLLSFGSHPNLETLIVANQKIGYSKFLKISDKFPKLRYLNLENIGLLGVEKDNYEEAFPALIYLNLAKNNIYENIDLSFVSKNLTYLSLASNRIYSLNLNKFENLEVLNLSKNSINTLDYSRGVQLNRLRKLRHLSLGENSIENIASETFFSMHELLSLNLSRNKLQEFPSGLFDELSSLMFLNLDNNNLERIPAIHTELKISTFSMNNNMISAIYESNFRTLLSLTQLYLNNNKIGVVDEYAFRNLENLQELHLANNNLTILPSGWSAGLTSLKYLDLSENKFMFLESLSLDPSLPLLQIDLQGDALTSFNAGSFDNLPANVTVNLRRNLVTNVEHVREKNMLFFNEYE